MDYLNQKDLFWKRNRYLDVYMKFSETRTIPGLKKHNFVRIGNIETKYVSYGWYVFFVLMTFGQLYKRYVDSFCVFQNFKVRKIVSTRYNLLEPQFI